MFELARTSRMLIRSPRCKYGLAKEGSEILFINKQY